MVIHRIASKRSLTFIVYDDNYRPRAICFEAKDAGLILDALEGHEETAPTNTTNATCNPPSNPSQLQ